MLTSRIARHHIPFSLPSSPIHHSFHKTSVHKKHHKRQGFRRERCFAHSTEKESTPIEASSMDNAEMESWWLGAYVVMGSLCLSDSALADGGSSNALLPGIGLVQGTILLAPVVLYTLFSIYRTAFNRNAKISDFLFLVASVFIFGNIFSALVFKVRLF